MTRCASVFQPYWDSAGAHPDPARVRRPRPRPRLLRRRASEFTGTIQHVCGLWPWVVGSASPTIGVPVGPHINGETTVNFDCISWFACAIDPATLLDQDGTLCLVAPVHAQNRLRPLFVALVKSVVREAQSRAQAGRPGDPRLLPLLDEAGNVAPLRDLPTIASTGRAQGIHVVSVWQDMAQITDRYGRLAATVVNNHRGKLALSGITDVDTLDYLSRLLGDTDIDRISMTDQAGGGHSTSRSQQRERLAPADALINSPAVGS
jgi:TraM recognition site of TraD and TraG